MRAYASIDGSQRPQTSLHWHVLAFFTPWMILGGFLTLPHLFADDKQLRTSYTAIRVLATLSITAGFGSTMLLTMVGPTWTFVLESVLLPVFSASCMALLSFIFLFVISSRYTWDSNAIVSTIFAILFFVYFACLSLYAHRKVLQERPEWQRPIRPLRPLPTISQLWKKISRQNKSPPRSGSINQEAPVEIISAPEDPNEEAQRRQMENLLQRGRVVDHAAVESASPHSTYRLDLPEDEELEETVEAGEAPISHRPSRRQSPHSSSAARTWVRPIMRNIAETMGGSGSGNASNLQPPPPISSARRGVTFHERSESREARRREIELGRWA